MRTRFNPQSADGSLAERFCRLPIFSQRRLPRGGGFDFQGHNFFSFDPNKIPLHVLMSGPSVPTSAPRRSILAEVDKAPPVQESQSKGPGKPRLQRGPLSRPRDPKRKKVSVGGEENLLLVSKIMTHFLQQNNGF